jgi:tetratricopeptide (TPR) repeat protein
MSPRTSERERRPRAMVYHWSMTPVLASLLLIAATADGHIGEEPAPIPAQSAPETTASMPEGEAATQPAAGETPAIQSSPPTVQAEAPAAPAEAPRTEDSGAAHPPIDTAGQPLPEATAPQVPAKPPARRPQLTILAQDSRMKAYAQFRQLYDTARFDEALPYAKQVVELSEQDPERDHELPIAYNNLGATQYQLGDYPGAAASYNKSLELLELTQGISSRRLIVPLAGLGAVSAAQDDHKTAAQLYDRALAVSRRADGLFNLQQLPLLKQAADSRYAFNDFGGAEREYMYALKIAEQNYGYGDPQTVPPLMDLATFYEGLREFIAARIMYMRARDVALKMNPGYSPMAVKSLVGIARCHRLQYTMDPDSLDSQQPARDEVTGEVIGKVYRESRVPPPAADRTGLKAVQQALDLLRSVSDPPAELMTETLIELGDWFQATSRPAMSMPYYEEAAGILDAQTANDPLAANPLKAPRMVFYRPPLSASRGLNTLSGEYVIHKTVFSFAVGEDGLPQDITVVSSDMNDDQVGLSRRALQKAIYSPRFTDGKAVSTAGVTFTAEWYVEHIPEQGAPNTPSTKPVEAGTVETASKSGS